MYLSRYFITDKTICYRTCDHPSIIVFYMYDNDGLPSNNNYLDSTAVFTSIFKSKYNFFVHYFSEISVLLN